MNKTGLKSFAISARKELLKKVQSKALKIGISTENIQKANIESSDAIFIDGRQLSQEERIQREKLIDRIKLIGFERVMEEVAYTWFNRFTALRFMEVNNYLPTKVRVLSSVDADSAEPDMMKEAMSLDLNLDKEYIYDLKLNNKTEELFKYLIIKHCNDMNRYLPFMFEKIDDYTEILFPEGLLAKDSFLHEMTDVEKISEDDWSQIEIIGWLYQFYIAEEKERVFKQKSKYKAEEIPFATQLFTPDWIVRYMVQNSLGRYWIEAHPENRDLIEEWEFYLEDPNSEQDLEEKLAPYINKELNVEDIKCFDPAMGSGHILVYMFDVLYEIYSKCGYMEREIPRLIIENNLYGLDIDDRAYQLACFSVVMKALQYNKRFFRSIERDGLSIQLASIQETNTLTDEMIAYIAGESSNKNFEQVKDFVNQFNDAKTLGSLIEVEEYNQTFLKQRLQYIQGNPAQDLFEEDIRSLVLELLPCLIKQADIMTKQYDILVTNPPYITDGRMNSKLYDYLKKFYPDSKADICGAFMEIYHYLKENGFMAMINQQSWMFLSSFTELRNKVISSSDIYSMLHLGSRAFEEISGEVVQATSFVLRNIKTDNKKGTYVRLVDFKDHKLKEEKTLEAIKDPNCNYRYYTNMEDFKKIIGTPISYWIKDSLRDIFLNNRSLGNVSKPRQGMKTLNNERFIRYWFEVGINKISFHSNSLESAKSSRMKWFPINHGGEFRKFYGNNESVVNWENDGFEMKELAVEKYNSVTRTITNISFYFKEGLTWTAITSGSLSVRDFKEGFLFSNAGFCMFESEDKNYINGLLNSKVSVKLLEVLSPTLNFNVRDIANIPFVYSDSNQIRQQINLLVEDCINISKNDWDSFEVSWGFERHPLLKHKEGQQKIKSAFSNWKNYTIGQFNKIKKNEEEINRLFINIYNLNEELKPDVEETDINIRIADREREIKSYISYFIGCILGRYSLNKDGIIFAGGDFYHSKYGAFQVDIDNILPILSGSYFEDDIVTKFIEFVKLTFGNEELSENLDFIADTLGQKKGETSKETIRRYFLNNFYKDHVQTYNKRPIYWLFTSGKQKAFNCLVYMHRYDKTTLSRIRTDYLHEYQTRLDTEKQDLLQLIESDVSTKEISNAKKELKALDKKIEELKEYDELLHHMADKQVEIDLDNGVKANYEKFKGLVAKI